MTAPDNDHERQALSAALATKWLAAHHAEDEDAGPIMRALLADPRGLALAFGALGELVISVLTKLDADGAIEGGVQVYLDRLALNCGAAADAVVARHIGEGGE
jgi:hypothetical protein